MANLVTKDEFYEFWKVVLRRVNSELMRMIVEVSKGRLKHVWMMKHQDLSQSLEVGMYGAKLGSFEVFRSEFKKYGFWMDDNDSNNLQTCFRICLSENLSGLGNGVRDGQFWGLTCKWWGFE